MLVGFRQPAVISLPVLLTAMPYYFVLAKKNNIGQAYSAAE